MRIIERIPTDTFTMYEFADETDPHRYINVTEHDDDTRNYVRVSLAVPIPVKVVDLWGDGERISITLDDMTELVVPAVTARQVAEKIMQALEGTT